jgi:hypothetical protein
MEIQGELYTVPLAVTAVNKTTITMRLIVLVKFVADLPD